MTDLEATKNLIKEAAPMPDLFRHYGVEVKRQGSSHITCCPFHEEKTPSCHVHDDYFHCFGCSISGDAIRFVELRERVEFMDALKILSEYTRIPLPQQDPQAAAAAAQRRQHTQAMLPLLSTVHAWLRQCLADIPEPSAYARRRGLTPALLDAFEVGYAPSAHHALRDWAGANGVTIAQLHAAGFWGGTPEEVAAGRGYARFRDRLMFPIHDHRGRLLGYSGRIITAGEKTAKYINSPESDWFTKGNVLFGLYQALPHVERTGELVLVEGQLDVIAMHTAGHPNTAAPLGTALTAAQAKLIARHAKKVTLCFDGDDAGAEATERAIDVLLPTGVDLWIADLPPGADPDSLINRNRKGGDEPRPNEEDPTA